MNVFEEAAVEYDEWFETHKWVYQSEVEAVRKFIPEAGEGNRDWSWNRPFLHSPLE